MKKPSFVLSDLLIALLLVILTFGLYFLKTSFIESFEYKLYDLRARLKQSRHASDKIAIVAIDEQSIATLGKWPWPRTVIAKLIDKISSADPKVIGLNILISEPDSNAGLDEIRSLKQNYIKMMFHLQKKLKSKSDIQMLSDFLVQISSSETNIDNDTILSYSIENSNKVVLPMFFVLGKSPGGEPTEIYDSISGNTIKNVETISDTKKLETKIMEAYSPIVPYDLFSNVSVGVGHANIQSDLDNVVRREILALYSNNCFYPSFALQLTRLYMGISLDDIKISLPKNLISIGNINVQFTDKMSMLINFAGPVNTYPYFSAFDVLNDKIPIDLFKNKIVLVGFTASGLSDLNSVPVGNNFTGTEIVANVIQNILEQKFIIRPELASKIEIALLFMSSVFVILFLPRLKAKWSSIFSLMLLIIIIFIGFYLFIKSSIWVKIIYPSFLLIISYIILMSKKFLITEKRKELVETESIETNKMLGLSFQGQGMLDLAFEKFRKCPIDDSMKDILYNLALDFERKRQFNKAIAVYEHIKSVDPKYKDLQERIKILKEASEGMVLGLGIKKTKGETVIMDGLATQKPTLGRYEVIKELGRGAMGIVYLGKDPKINRMVAIKTLRFEDDIPEEEMKEIKQRFFREAESAGNLSHPNIIKIYDAGEDYDISYMAMELLEGKELKEYCDKNNLLPVKDVVKYIIQIADALDYAHQRGVVHRDIKPANVMILNDGTLRVTDFGIARIMSSSKTQTGTVLGTPSYMSPEQISGKKVDGRSDLFSLGVMFYELLTGEKPFQGDNIATLLFQISNTIQKNPKQINNNIPDCLLPIIDKMLKKNPDERYQRGKEIVDDLKKCLQIIEGNINGTVSEQQTGLKTAITEKRLSDIEVKVKNTEDTVKINDTIKISLDDKKEDKNKI